MSGVMIKTGIYGLVRALTFLGPPPAWWGWLLVGDRADLGRARRALRAGAARPQAAAGVPQRGEHRHHRAGAGRRAARRQRAACRCWRCSGSPARCCTSSITRSSRGCCSSARARCSTRRARARSTTSAGCSSGCPGRRATFLVGAAAISGLPPLNGFVSEFLIYLGAFHGGAALSGANAVASLFVIAGPGADRRAGAGLLRQGVRHRLPGRAAQRTRRCTRTRPGLAMRLPMLLLAAVCLAIGLLRAAGRPRAGARRRLHRGGRRPPRRPTLLSAAALPLSGIVLCAAGFLVLAALLGWLRLPARGPRRSGADGHVGLRLRAADGADAVHRLVLRPAADGPVPGLPRHARRLTPPQGALPTQPSAFHSETPDVFTERCFRPVVRRRRLADGAPAPAPARARAVVRALRGAHARRAADLVPGVAVMNAIQLVHPLLALLLAPLLLGVINRTKAFFAGRTGPPLLQLYFDLCKLLRKGAVYSRTTTWVFRAGPVVGLAAATAALALVPFGGQRALVELPGRPDRAGVPAGADALLHGPRRARHRLGVRGHGREPRGAVLRARRAGAAARARRGGPADGLPFTERAFAERDARRRHAAGLAAAPARRSGWSRRRCWWSSWPRTRAFPWTTRTRTWN